MVQSVTVINSGNVQQLYDSQNRWAFVCRRNDNSDEAVLVYPLSTSRDVCRLHTVPYKIYICECCILQLQNTIYCIKNIVDISKQTKHVHVQFSDDPRRCSGL